MIVILLTQGFEIDFALWKKIWLLFFFVIFMFIVLRLIFLRSGYYRADAQIPLEDDPVQSRGPAPAPTEEKPSHG